MRFTQVLGKNHSDKKGQHLQSFRLRKELNASINGFILKWLMYV